MLAKGRIKNPGGASRRRNVKTPVFGVIETGGKVIVKVFPLVAKALQGLSLNSM